MLIKKIPDGPAGIAETVTAIIALAHDPNSTREIRDIALWICKKANAKTEMEMVKAVHDWMKKHVKYVLDPIYREFVQSPLWLIKQGMKRSHKAAGDCDDHACCNMALISALGIRTRAVITEDPTRPGPADAPFWAHIFTEAQARKTPRGKRIWTPVDSSMWFLKFGEKVGGRSTIIYPGDIPPDIIYDAAKGGNTGLGFVSKAIHLGSPFVNRVMSQRTSKGGAFNFNFTVNGANPPPANGLGWAGIVTGLVSTGTGLVQAAINKRLQEKLSKRQTQLERMKIAAATRLEEKALELEFQSRELDAERSALLQSEKDAFARFRSASKTDRITAAALVGVPLIALFALNFLQRKKKVT